MVVDLLSVVQTHEWAIYILHRYFNIHQRMQNDAPTSLLLWRFCLLLFSPGSSCLVFSYQLICRPGCCCAHLDIVHLLESLRNQKNEFTSHSAELGITPLTLHPRYDVVVIFNIYATEYCNMCWDLSPFSTANYRLKFKLCPYLFHVNVDTVSTSLRSQNDPEEHESKSSEL